MDEVLELCRRVLGSEQRAREAAAAASVAGAREAAATASGAGAREARLAAALAACRRLLAAYDRVGSTAADDRVGGVAADDRGGSVAPASPGGAQQLQRPSTTLSAAVAGELARANGLLEAREREALALAELLGADHAQIAEVIGIEVAAAGRLLARARLDLRARLRGAELTGSCAQRERALVLLTRRQDSARLSAEEEAWLLDHLRACELCERSHAAMLEASACYRAWQPGPLD